MKLVSTAICALILTCAAACGSPKPAATPAPAAPTANEPDAAPVTAPGAATGQSDENAPDKKAVDDKNLPADGATDDM